MLLCDNCNRGFHKKCIGAIISDNDNEPWYCSDCLTHIVNSETKDPT